MTIEFDENGYALTSGYTTVYTTAYGTREFTGAHEAYISAHTGVAAQAYLDMPPKQKDGFAICRTTDDKGWEYVEDHRGEARYSTITKEKINIYELGEYPRNSTDMEPSLFDIWDGSKWIVDEKAKSDAMIQSATEKQTLLMMEASIAMAPLQDAVDLDDASTEEIALLKKWKQYRVALNRLDLSTAPDIDWGTPPKKQVDVI
jgi:hypothetical protein